MNLIEMRWKSGIIGHATDMVILLPEAPKFPPPWPVLYLLHGRSDDASAWTRFTTLERQADGFPFLIVMPSSYITYYRDPIEREGMESALVRELIPLIESTFHIRDDRESRYVAGLSMGGYGALWLATQYPDLFAGASAHSPAVIESRRGDDVDRKHHLAEIWGSPTREDRTLFHALAHSNHDSLPKLRIDCGDRDFLLDEARALHSHLTDCGIAHTYVERPGAHDWNYWERVVGETLRFCMTLHSKAAQAD